MLLRPPSPLYSSLLLTGAGPGNGGDAPPSTPADFTATPGDRETVLTWTASSGATGYEIKVNTTDNIHTASVLGTGIAGTSFTHDAGESIQVGEKYFYWIKAIGSGGDSAFSSSISGRSYVILQPSQTTSLSTPSGSWTISTIIFSLSALPVGILISVAPKSYEYVGGGNWLDSDDASNANNVAISGSFDVTHAELSSFTIWNTEP